MANVLPKEGIHMVRKRMSSRFLLIGSLVMATSAVLAIMSILPAFISVKISRASLEASVQAAAREHASDDQAAIVRTQGLMKVLAPIASATSSPSETLARVLEAKPTGISISTITYTGAAKSTMVLSGVSARREAVSQFRDALEKTHLFSEVSVPVGALVGTQEGRFNVTLVGSF